jgi:uncharacterized protein YdeI (YjbR/CyaY-like superfamily)
MKKVDSVEEYIEVNSHYSEALTLLRELLLSTELEESLKWSAPVYTIAGKNVIGLGAFKHHIALWFFNGVFLKDEKNLLEQAQEKTKGLRSLKYTSLEEIDKNVVLAYVKEAIANQKAGKELKPERKGKSVSIPKELQAAFKSNSELTKAFKALTPGKQREYAEHIATAKQDKTKQSRIKKITPMILQGVGLHDKYKNC